MVHVPTAGSPETAAVRSMFDRIAPRYDLLNRLLSAGIDTRWRRAAAEALGPQGETARILDLCTGTGDLLVEALGRGARRRGVGIDLSEQMLARGTRKLERRGLSARAALAVGDGERLPLRPGSSTAPWWPSASATSDGPGMRCESSTACSARVDGS